MNNYQKTMFEIVNHIIINHPELNENISEVLRKQKESSANQLPEIFNYIYRNNAWGSAESVSGPGSESENTQNLREKLPEIFSKYGVNTVLDAPCGDFNWMRMVVEKTEVNYIGADIVNDLIALNSQRYASDKVKFVALDITKDAFPSVDLLICRDCLFHLSYENINKFVNNFINSNIKYILTTSYAPHIFDGNKDISDGGFRAIDLYSDPFNFPKESLEVIADFAPGQPERYMIMWSREQLINS